MFKCQNCSKSTDRPIRVVTERKMVDHLKGANIGPHGGRGSQIVKEMNVCAACLSQVREAPKPEAEVAAVVAAPATTAPTLAATIADAVS